MRQWSSLAAILIFLMSCGAIAFPVVEGRMRSGGGPTASRGFPHFGEETPASLLQANAGGRYVRRPENESRFGLALQAAFRQDFPRAIQLLREITTSEPDDFDAWNELGTAYFKQGNLKNADTCYQRALQLRPSAALFLLNLGKLQIARGKPEAALNTLLRVATIMPQSAQGQFYLGEAFLQTKKGSRALIHFREALNLDPAGMAEAHLRLAALYQAADMKDRAAAEYEQYLARRPDYPDRQKLLKYIKANKK
jgi:tetratricopeptide (TPR) repeat protein